MAHLPFLSQEDYKNSMPVIDPKKKKMGQQMLKDLDDVFSHKALMPAFNKAAEQRRRELTNLRASMTKNEFIEYAVGEEYLPQAQKALIENMTPEQRKKLADLNQGIKIFGLQDVFDAYLKMLGINIDNQGLFSKIADDIKATQMTGVPQGIVGEKGTGVANVLSKSAYSKASSSDPTVV